MTSTIKVDNIQDQDGNNIINENANTITIGASGDTVTLASGASQTGFGRTGTVDWQTSIKTATFTAANGEGYFCNTSGGAFTVTLPASPSAGDIVAIKDYANTADTNNITIGRNGSNIDGTAEDPVIANEGGSIVLVYADATKGWLVVEAAQKSDIAFPTYITASGGNNIITCGNFKSHIFTGPGTFTVCSVGNSAGSNSVDYLVVAGGGGASGDGGAGGGGGGFRLSNTTCMPAPQTSPLASSTAIPVSATGFPITVGSGGSGAPSGNAPSTHGSQGSNSVFSTITSTGGGGGGYDAVATNPTGDGRPGGSGGGAKRGGGHSGGSGNTPPVSPPQGFDGGNTPAPPNISPSSSSTSAGGGGASAVGACGTTPNPNTGTGGAGSFVVQSGFAGPGEGTSGPVPGAKYFSGGGAGGGPCGSTNPGGVGGGAAAVNGTGANGTASTGGGGSGGNNDSAGGSGGSGIVIIRYKFQ